jgi:hypothetical protein
MEDGTTYDVRTYRTEVYKGVKVTTYRVRWKTGHSTSRRKADQRSPRSLPPA